MAKMEITAKNGQLLPAYPLFVKDPFFSIWSPADKLNGGDTIFWTGARRRIYGIVNCDGKSYSFLGFRDKTEQLEQTGVSLTAFSTDYSFTAPEFDLKVSFLSPLPPDNLELLSCPVCYLSYEVKPKKNIEKLSVSLFVHEETCYDRVKSPVRGGVHTLPEGECAWFGLKKQQVMSQAFDDSAAEWGYWYLTGQKAFLVSWEAIDKYALTGELDFICNENSEKFIAAENIHENFGGKVSGMLTFAFDDTVSVFYYGDWLKGYWFEGGKTIFDAITYSYNNYEKITKELDKFDADLKKRAEKYGEDYLLILYAGLRQSVGAHKLVKDRDGNVLFLSKECHSNGCIATVDVSYPSIPLFLLYNPELVKGMMRPIFKFNDMPVWKYDFAPHDAGTYPYCLGQVYGLRVRREEVGKESVDITNRRSGFQPDLAYNYPLFYNFPASADIYSFEGQMPVEECGNMLIMVAATYLADKDKTIAEANFKTLTDWVQYLLKYGLMPGNQLCTDDFAGHLDKNINLSVKAIVGIRAYAIICEALGKAAEAAEYTAVAEKYAAEWKKMCVKAGKRVPLVFDGDEDTFSLKYNMAFDVMFGTGLFDKDIRETETDYYIEAANKYGVPLDSRSTYTKSDWILWAATLTDSVEKRKKILAPVADFLRESTSRYPFTDWYYTDLGTIRGDIGNRGYHYGFKNRTVQGGLFILLLADSGIMQLKK
ncbi:MAG: glutaminase domain-containing protein [Christensenellales bacterium]